MHHATIKVATYAVAILTQPNHTTLIRLQCNYYNFSAKE